MASPTLGELDPLLSLSECKNDGIVEGPTASAPLVIVATGIIGIVFSLWLLGQVAAVKLDVTSVPGSTKSKDSALQNTRLLELYNAITLGASSFLTAEYKLCLLFVVVVCPCMYFSIGALSAISFVVGALTSMVSGLIGMKIAVFGNARCTVGACSSTVGWTESFNTAFRAGGVMGFSLTGIALLSLYALMLILTCALQHSSLSLSLSRPTPTPSSPLLHFFSLHANARSPFAGGTVELMECLAGFGLGGSCIAMFGRVGGGIYTKAADVGADLAGKVVEDLPEDDPHNPGTIADNVGDNVGDVAGMGSDLFGSFGEATCAALLVGASSPALVSAGAGALTFPLTISGAGIVVCLVTNFFATDFMPVSTRSIGTLFLPPSFFHASPTVPSLVMVTMTMMTMITGA